MDSFDTEQELMQRIAGGDTAAYRELVTRHLTLSLRFTQRMVGIRADAEDIVQEAFFKLWTTAASWQPRAKISSWLYRVLYNACMDHHRKVIHFSHQAIEQIVDDTPSPEEILGEDQQARRVRFALARLPDRQRAALVLSYYEELSDHEAASVLGISTGAFEQLLFRARAKLRAALTAAEETRHHG